MHLKFMFIKLAKLKVLERINKAKRFQNFFIKKINLTLFQGRMKIYLQSFFCQMKANLIFRLSRIGRVFRLRKT